MRQRRGVKVHLLHQMKDSGKWEWRSSVVRGAHGKKVMRAVENYRESSADIQVDVGVLELFDRARRRRKGLSEVHLEVLDEKRKQHLPVLQYKREKGPSCCKQKTLAGAPKSKGSYAGEVAK